MNTNDTGVCPECGQVERIETHTEGSRDESCKDCGLILRMWIGEVECEPTNVCSTNSDHDPFDGFHCPSCYSNEATRTK